VAKDAFSAQGYTATSLRAVARAAGVDPSLVTHFFNSKAGLFEAAFELPVDPATLVGALLAEDVAGLGERMFRAFLAV